MWGAGLTHNQLSGIGLTGQSRRLEYLGKVPWQNNDDKATFRDILYSFNPAMRCEYFAWFDRTYGDWERGVGSKEHWERLAAAPLVNEEKNIKDMRLSLWKRYCLIKTLGPKTPEDTILQWFVEETMDLNVPLEDLLMQGALMRPGFIADAWAPNDPVMTVAHRFGRIPGDKR